MMEKTITVSVIIPVFNGAQCIQGAIESVLNQTFKDLEIIVVDDGSTDDTKTILDPLVKEGKIQYIYQPNKGLAGARNTGIRHAKGQYLKFLDCDDILYSQQLELQVKHLQNKPYTVISATDYELEFETKNKISVHLYLRNDLLAQFIEGNPCPVHTILINRNLVEQAGSFDETLLSHEDSDLWLRILMQGGSFEKVEYIGCCYRIHKGALSDNSSKMFQHQIKFTEKLNQTLMPQFDQLPQETLRQLYYRNFQDIHKCFAQTINPSQYLHITLKANQLLYLKKASILGKIKIFLLGFKNIAWKEYTKSCQIDPNYSKKLMSTAWRNEEFYQWEKFPYLKKASRNKKIKNVLYLNSSSVIYGAETRLLDILKHLDGDNYHPFVLLPHPGPLDERLKELGVIVMHLEYGFPLNIRDIFKKEAVLRFLRLNRDFVRLVRQHDIDIIHANLHINISKFWLAFLILRIPVIVHMRSHFWLSMSEKFLICKLSKAIFISDFVRQEFYKKRRFNFLMSTRPNHNLILHDGIDIDHFSPMQPRPEFIRKELKINSKAFVIGIIGAVDKVKGQDLLLKAVALVIPKHPHVKIIVVGDLYHPSKANIEYRDGLLKIIKDHNLTDHVIFTGIRSDINYFMNEIDLLVQPSEREALGTSMVEAMACGKPVIGSKVDGIPEVIGDNESGILLDPRTPEAFAEAINFFIENPQEAHKRGLQGRERALRVFNIFTYNKRIQGLYDDVMPHRW